MDCPRNSQCALDEIRYSNLLSVMQKCVGMILEDTFIKLKKLPVYFLSYPQWSVPLSLYVYSQFQSDSTF